MLLIINHRIMRVFLSVLILIFSLQSLIKADDISDFEIEGMSIGDSLLDFFSEEKINSSYQIKYEIDKHRDWEWNPIILVDEIFNGLFILSESSMFTMDKRVESISSRLAKVPALLQESKKTIIYYSPIHVSYTKTRINKIIKLPFFFQNINEKMKTIYSNF